MQQKLYKHIFMYIEGDNKLVTNKISFGYSQFHCKKQTLSSQADTEIWIIDENDQNAAEVS